VKKKGRPIQTKRPPIISESLNREAFRFDVLQKGQSATMLRHLYKLSNPQLKELLRQEDISLRNNANNLLGSIVNNLHC
jgi:hypothetical protein